MKMSLKIFLCFLKQGKLALSEEKIFENLLIFENGVKKRINFI